MTNKQKEINQMHDDIIISKCMNCKYKQCFMRFNVSRTIKCKYEQENDK